MLTENWITKFLMLEDEKTTNKTPQISNKDYFIWQEKCKKNSWKKKFRLYCGLIYTSDNFFDSRAFILFNSILPNKSE